MLVIIDKHYYRVNLGKSWENLESDLIIRNKLNFKSDLIFRKGGSTLTRTIQPISLLIKMSRVFGIFNPSIFHLNGINLMLLTIF